MSLLDIKGRKSHQIVEEGLQVLINLGHRGAAGSDPETGDGAGGTRPDASPVLSQGKAGGLGFELPEDGAYGVGMVFLRRKLRQPRGPGNWCRGVIADEGLEALAWRDVPLDYDKLGRDSRRRCPLICQVFVGPGNSGLDPAQLERKLYVVRKVIEHSMKDSRLTEEELDYFYVCSLSCNTIVYKGPAHGPPDFRLLS